MTAPVSTAPDTDRESSRRNQAVTERVAQHVRLGAPGRGEHVNRAAPRNRLAGHPGRIAARAAPRDRRRHEMSESRPPTEASWLHGKHAGGPNRFGSGNPTSERHRAPHPLGAAPDRAESQRNGDGMPIVTAARASLCRCRHRRDQPHDQLVARRDSEIAMREASQERGAERSGRSGPGVVEGRPHPGDALPNIMSGYSRHQVVSENTRVAPNNTGITETADGRESEARS